MYVTDVPQALMVCTHLYHFNLYTYLGELTGKALVMFGLALGLLTNFAQAPIAPGAFVCLVATACLVVTVQRREPFLTHIFTCIPVSVVSTVMPENCTPRETSDVNSGEAQGSVKPRPQRFRRFMALVLIGTPSLRRLLRILEQEDETRWRELKGQLIDRTSNVTIVGSLATAATISFLTSKSPSPIVAWDDTFPYICLFAGGLCSVLCVVSGLGLVMFLNAVEPQTIKEINTSTFKLTVVALLLAMPFFWLFMGILLPIIAMAGAVWLGSNTFAKAGATMGFIGLIATLLVIFASLYYSCITGVSVAA